MNHSLNLSPFSLQTGMRGAWGKPYGTVARVNIGQIILSIRCKDQNAAVVQEALRRARYKFPGRQKIIVSRKWGFTNVNREDYLKLKEDKRVLQYVSLPVHRSPHSHVSQGWRLCSVHPPQGQSREQPPCSAPRVILYHVYYRSPLQHECDRWDLYSTLVCAMLFGMYSCSQFVIGLDHLPHIHYIVLIPWSMVRGNGAYIYRLQPRLIVADCG